MMKYIYETESAFISYTFQDIEKEVRKEVDEAIAQAKVRSAMLFIFCMSGILACQEIFT